LIVAHFEWPDMVITSAEYWFYEPQGIPADVKKRTKTK
jgi:hypothetical protein